MAFREAREAVLLVDDEDFAVMNDDGAARGFRLSVGWSGGDGLRRSKVRVIGGGVIHEDIIAWYNCDMESEGDFSGKWVLRGKQAWEVIRYVQEEYGCELEFLWQDENAVWRNPTNRKWFGVILKVKGGRLGLSVEGDVAALDLRFEKGMAREFVAARGGSGGMGRGSDGDETEKGAGILLGYHMNKDNWITVVLNYGVATEEILGLIDQSYRIVAEGR